MLQLVVEHNEVRLYMDCGEAERTTFRRRPEKLTFSQNSGIFVANAGSTGLDKFEVSKRHYSYIWCAFLFFYIYIWWMVTKMLFFLNKDRQKERTCHYLCADGPLITMLQSWDAWLHLSPLEMFQHSVQLTHLCSGFNSSAILDAETESDHFRIRMPFVIVDIKWKSSQEAHLNV